MQVESSLVPEPDTAQEPVVERSSRIFVQGISPQTTAADLDTLFSKLGRVAEVYLPARGETGLRRDFAVATLASSAEAKACIKAFNGSVWRGAKLRL
ncbi:hypothetical protein B484DRAFT_331459, partial [Ochromonadaceae sp. CCMP2298]